MNHAALLALISDLYAQHAVLTARNSELEARVRELQAELDQARPDAGSRT
jgi:cell division protein FtsB